MADVVGNYAGLSEQRSDFSMRLDDVSFLLRRANNVCKGFSIERAAEEASVETGEWCADFGCGKGGDVKKYEAAGVWRLWFVDVVEKQLLDLGARVREMRASSTLSPAFACRVVQLDLSSWSGRLGWLSSVRAAGVRFSAIFSHFALHYMCPTSADLAHMFHIISLTLRDGGIFSAIFSRWEDVGEAWSSLPDGVSSSPLATCSRVALARGGVYARFRFEMRGAVEGVVESSLPLNDVMEAAERFGLECVARRDLRSLYAEDARAWEWAGRMNRTWQGEGGGGEEQEVRRLMERYVWTAFRKRTKP